MGITSKISWTHHTASPWFGCSKVSPGCTNCYAEELTLRNKWAGWGDNAPRVRSKGFWKDVYKWDRAAAGAAERPRTFTSLMDFLDPNVPIPWFAQYMDVVRNTRNLDHLLLTKRPELFRPRMEESLQAIADDCEGEFYESAEDARLAVWIQQWVDGKKIPHNVWLGVTAEDQRRYDERAEILYGIPARVRWFSFEPLLEDIQLRWATFPRAGGQIMPGPLAFHWAVVGGESGKNRRDPGIEPLLSIVDQCQAANVPVWVKQDCALKPGQQGRIPDNVWNLKELPK